ELIRNSTDRWFNAPMDEILSSANRIAADYYAERQRLVLAQAERIAKPLGEVDLQSASVPGLQDRLGPEVAEDRLKLVEVFRVTADAGASRVAPTPLVVFPTLRP